MSHDKLITVIVTTYNRPDALELVIGACLDQTDRHFEIVIADDGSGAATRTLIENIARASPVSITHVWQPDEGFRAAASRNKALRSARGDYVIFLDGDCVPQRDFVARHRALAHERTVVTGSRILLAPRLTNEVLTQRLPLQRQPLTFWLRQRAAAQVNKVLPLAIRLPDLPLRRVDGFVWRGIKTCNLAAWLSDLEAVNGFDETFVGWGHEDADLVARLHNAGVVRKNGFWSTEVLHLWHAEAPRDREGPNYARVLARLADRTTRAERGLQESAHSS
ncbi:glycosyl transferase family 2 [Trinickia symbiotica]|uniref:Glycosyl transferase family 2 n=1 Tax=Trinickia symbiotica TaxID=863227 RepID=A0A2T3XSE6_9BURK|nr:glycosyltransferase family 2 protein [Trinickia symbiotica]PTB19382.1 glycosyl transferase family 2 [Trinickia symbiotica]